MKTSRTPARAPPPRPVLIGPRQSNTGLFVTVVSLRSTPVPERSRLQDNAVIAPFSQASVWNLIQRIGELPASGDATYDAFIIEILTAAGVEAIATANAKEFRRLFRPVRIIDPCERGE